MFAKNDLGEYETVINRLTFVCDEADSECEARAEAIAQCYRDKLPLIAQFMKDEGIDEFFGDIPSKMLESSLGSPIISLDRNTVTYPDNSLDDMLIIEFRFEGILENFSSLDVDG